MSSNTEKNNQAFAAVGQRLAEVDGKTKNVVTAGIREAETVEFLKAFDEEYLAGSIEPGKPALLRTNLTF